MLKKIGASVAAGAFALLVTGCGGSSQAASTPAPPQATAAPVWVSACNPGGTLNADVEAKNSGGQVTAYDFTVYWFDDQGQSKAQINWSTAAMPAGGTWKTTINGQPLTGTRYQPTKDWTCQIKVTGQH